MAPDLIWAPDFFGLQEISRGPNFLGPKKGRGPSRTISDVAYSFSCNTTLMGPIILCYAPLCYLQIFFLQFFWSYPFFRTNISETEFLLALCFIVTPYAYLNYSFMVWLGEYKFFSEIIICTTTICLWVKTEIIEEFYLRHRQISVPLKSSLIQRISRNFLLTLYRYRDVGSGEAGGT